MEGFGELTFLPVAENRKLYRMAIWQIAIRRAGLVVSAYLLLFLRDISYAEEEAKSRERIRLQDIKLYSLCCQ
jgi:hypothetical protein